MLKAKIKQNNQSVAAARRQKKSNADNLAHNDALCTSLAEQLLEIRSSVTRDRAELRQQSRELTARVKEADEEQKELAELYEEFIRHAVGRQLRKGGNVGTVPELPFIKKRKDCKRRGRLFHFENGHGSATPEVSVEDVLEHGALDSDADPQSNSKESENKYTAGPASLSPTTEGQGNKEEIRFGHAYC